MYFPCLRTRAGYPLMSMVDGTCRHRISQMDMFQTEFLWNFRFNHPKNLEFRLFPQQFHSLEHFSKIVLKRLRKTVNIIDHVLLS